MTTSEPVSWPLRRDLDHPGISTPIHRELEPLPDNVSLEEGIACFSI